MDGYHGRLLIVDLTRQIVSDELLNENYARDFVGSSGLAARYLYDMVDENTDPLGPENPLIFMTGMLNGTSGPSLSRWSGVTKSPYTGHYGDSNAGGYFGAELKLSGYDGIILKGQSEQPVYLDVKDGVAQVKDATHLWGRDTPQTQKILKKEYNDKRIQIICIGPASENLVLYGNVVTELGHCLGRAGLGCVMGAKKIKAIVVRGKNKIPMADEKRFKESAHSAMREVKDAFMTMIMHETGTAGWVDGAISYGDSPAKYYTAPSIEEATDISGVTMSETCEIGHTGCYGCPIRCRKVLKITQGKYLYDKVEGPEYESIIGLGALMGLKPDMSTIVYMNELCNAYGFDSISGGASCAYAFYLYEKGVITKADTDGLELTWGNIVAACELLHKVGKNEGFGKIVSTGTKRMAQRYDRPPGEAVQVKGLEFPMHDPRAYHSMGLVYATSPRGADHNKSDAYQVDIGSGHPELELPVEDRWDNDKAAIVEKSQNFRMITDAIGLCHFAQVPFSLITQMVNASAGWDLTMEDLLKAGERIFQLQRSLSCKLGIQAKDDCLPELAMQPISDGGQEGHVPDMEKMLTDYYVLRDWDKTSGKPSKNRMESLGIKDI